ncbi:MAG: hypothetical protein ACE5HO_14060 [bacterium]
MRKCLAVVFILFGGATISPNFLSAQINFNGGRGLTYVQSAWTLQPGFLTVNALTRSYGKVGNFTQGAVTVWDVTGRFSVNYGLGKHLELAISPTIYGDTNRGSDDVNAPDDLYIGLKIGSFASTGSSVAYGLTLNTRFPSGQVHNVAFEPYSSDHVAWGLTGLVTYSKDPLYPEDATNIHLNLGYWNHNDVGAGIDAGGGSSAEAKSMSQEFLYGVGIKVPTEKFDFSVELVGNAFLQRPPAAAYSREDYAYLSPTISYKPYRWFSINFGADFRITDSSDKTNYAFVSRTLPGSQPNYPGWRAKFGTKITLLPSSVYRVNERDILMQKAETRRELFEQIIKEQRQTESAEAELERIKDERRRAEKELERLRKILEGEASDADQAKKNDEDKPEPLE